MRSGLTYSNPSNSDWSMACRMSLYDRSEEEREREREREKKRDKRERERGRGGE